MKEPRSPIAVLISDIHYNINTLPVADAALRQAIAKANELDVVLIVTGDLHDTKANLRAECVNAMLKTFSLADINPIILVGNHDLINEKDTSKHALEFLQGGYATVQKHCGGWGQAHLAAYHSDVEQLRSYLKTIPKGETVIMHQGLESSDTGDYIQDKSALKKEDVAGLRIISGHYHTRQTIALPDGGTWDYVGNPFTLTWGEAKDPEKGYQILYDDSSLKFVPTSLRKHIVVEMDVEDTMTGAPSLNVNDGDLLLIKLKGTKEELATFDKDRIAKNLGIKGTFRLDLIPLDTATERQESPQKEITKPALLDSLIDSTRNTSVEQRERIKKLWRNL